MFNICKISINQK